MKAIEEIKERLSVELTYDDLKQWRVSDIANLRLDAKRLLAEVENLQKMKAFSADFFESLYKLCNRVYEEKPEVTNFAEYVERLVTEDLSNNRWRNGMV